MKQQYKISAYILSLLISCIFAVSISYAQDFREPVDNLTLSSRNDYGTYNYNDKKT